MAHLSTPHSWEIKRFAEDRNFDSNQVNEINQLEDANWNQDASKQMNPVTNAPAPNEEEVNVVSRFASANLSSSRETAIIERHQIRDRFKVVAISYLLLGIGYILPWVVTTTATPYYTGFKLSWLSPTLAKEKGLLGSLHEYKDFFIHYLGIVVQVPNIAVSGWGGGGIQYVV